MFFEAIAMMAVATAPAPVFTGEFVGYKKRQQIEARWERFDLKLTNNSKGEQKLGVCPMDADIVLKTRQASQWSAFAIKFDKEDWSFGCEERAIAPGESTTLSLFFRPDFEPGPQRYISVKTTKGDFLVGS